MNESDWKIFKEIKEKAIERFCEIALEEISDVINDKSEHPHNRYLLSYRLLQNREKQMKLIFDGQSRSKARIQLLGIRAEGLADETLLKDLTHDFNELTDPEKNGW